MIHKDINTIQVVCETSKCAKFKLHVKSYPNDSKGIFRANYAPNEMGEREKKVKSEGVTSRNSKLEKRKDILNKVSELLQEQKKRELKIER